MTTVSEVQNLLTSIVAELFEMKGIDEAVREDTIIFGSGSSIDSLDLVNIIVRLEEEIKEKTGKSITVVDEQSLITGDSPFRSVGTLSKLVTERIRA